MEVALLWMFIPFWEASSLIWEGSSPYCERHPLIVVAHYGAVHHIDLKHKVVDWCYLIFRRDTSVGHWREDETVIATSGMGSDSHREPVTKVLWTVDSSSKASKYQVQELNE
ncbi:WD repeat-containing protein 34 [Desmophyllum pertusum]|uniref:WD repeat-containing protein 34 n=1 Tax=Desmophyllum pertusum TaxID=174260 RepID=A0A9W9ZZT8_9CNID|nr:WD repeat-containing protein 34 [Desmophyllum pertusum]